MKRQTPKSFFGAFVFFLTAILFNSVVGATLGGVVGHPYLGAVLANGVGVAQNCVRMYYSYQGIQFTQPNLLFAGLSQEVFIDDLVLQLRADTSFIEDGEDWSEWVDQHQVNFAAEGADPVVTINNSSWPLTPTQRTDTPLGVTLDNFSSTPTRVTNIESVELVYDKLSTVNRQHVLAIQQQYGIYAAWNWAPAANISATPVIVATGAADASGLKILTSADIAALALAFDTLLYPDQGRTIVMDPGTMWSLINNDPKLTQQYGFHNTPGSVPGVITDYYGFKIRKYVYVPTYRLVSSVWTKNALGSTPVAGTDFKGAIAYIAKNGIAKAWGQVKMYSQMNEPTYQADVISYSARATARAKQQARIGAIIRTT